YGAQWLRELGEDTDLRQRHRDFHLGEARRAYACWMGGKQVAWYERVRAAYPDMRVALEHCLTGHGLDLGDGRAALDMAGALWFFWYACGFQREGRHYLERALSRSPGASPERTRAAWARGLITLSQGDLEATDDCISICRAGKDPSSDVAAAFLEGAGLTL